MFMELNGLVAVNASDGRDRRKIGMKRMIVRVWRANEQVAKIVRKKTCQTQRVCCRAPKTFSMDGCNQPRLAFAAMSVLMHLAQLARAEKN